jgi:xanthine dehydrogenase accessory factor
VSYANKYVEKLAEMDRQGQPFVSVTLIETVGSTPQDAGSKMLVDSRGLAFGTVGGGRVELKAIQLAQEMLAETSPRTSSFVEWNLQRDVGMTCGGVVKLFFETFNRRNWHIVIFGAGHVAQALVRTLLHLDCQVTCIDSRQDWLERLPDSPKLTVKQSDQPADEVPLLDEHDFVICMTMGHRTDRPILKRIFQLQRQFAYLGVIGSQAKRKVLVRELKEDGISQEWADQFACPIGLPLGNNQPYEIAISITN